MFFQNFALGKTRVTGTLISSCCRSFFKILFIMKGGRLSFWGLFPRKHLYKKGILLQTNAEILDIHKNIF